jgi:hypothetical protein
MIERYTIKFGPAVSQKELEKLLDMGDWQTEPRDIRKMKVRIEFIGGFEEVKKVDEFVKKLRSDGGPN